MKKFTLASFSLLFILFCLQGHQAHAEKLMRIEWTCSVKQLGSAADELTLSTGDTVTIVTTTLANYKPPFYMVDGENSLTTANTKIEGTVGQYTYSAADGDVFQAFDGSQRLFLLKGIETSTYTGKSKVSLYLETKKAAGLVCTRSKTFR